MANRKMSVSKWQDRILRTNKIYEPWHNQYKTWVRFFRGEQWTTEELVQVDNPIVINYVFNTIKTLIPTLFFKNPKMFVSPTRPEFIDAAILAQEIINYDWHLLELKKEIKLSILRTLIGGLSWFETGYTFEVEEVQDEAATQAEVEAALRGETATADNPGQEFTEFKIKRDQPYGISRSILNVRTDPTVDVFDEMGWFAIREVKPLERVKKDPRFKGTKNLKANKEFDDRRSLNDFREEMKGDEDTEFVEMWHVTDRWEGRTFTIANGHDRRLREFDTPVGYGITPLSFNDDPEQPQPISVVELMHDIQKEKNRLRSYMLAHIKRNLPRFGWNAALAPDEEDMKKFADSEQNEIVPLPGDPNQIAKAFSFPSLNSEVFGVDTKSDQDMTIASGLSDFNRSIAAKVPSATEAQLIEQSSRLRVDESLDSVSDFCAEVSRKLFALRQQFTTGEQVVPIAGEGPSRQWRTYTREEIQGDFEFRVEYGSTQKKDRDFQVNLWAQNAPTLLQLAQTNSGGFAPAGIIGRQMAKALEIPAPLIEQMFPQAPSPQQVQPGPLQPNAIEQILGGAL